jgi:hypothetical protein
MGGEQRHTEQRPGFTFTADRRAAASHDIVARSAFAAVASAGDAASQHTAATGGASPGGAGDSHLGTAALLAPHQRSLS